MQVDHGAEPDALRGDSQRSRGRSSSRRWRPGGRSSVGVDAHRFHPLHQSDEALVIRRLRKDADAEADPVRPLGDPRVRPPEPGAGRHRRAATRASKPPLSVEQGV